MNASISNTPHKKITLARLACLCCCTGLAQSTSYVYLAVQAWGTLCPRPLIAHPVSGSYLSSNFHPQTSLLSVFLHARTLIHYQVLTVNRLHIQANWSESVLRLAWLVLLLPWIVLPFARISLRLTWIMLWLACLLKPPIMEMVTWFSLSLQSAVCILPSGCILPPVCSLQSAVFILQWPWHYYTDKGCPLN